MTNRYCTIEVYELQERNVMKSQTTPFFHTSFDVLQSCEAVQASYFDKFCLFPPNENNLTTMCQMPTALDQTSLFYRMFDNKLKHATELPLIISYEELQFEMERQDRTDWVTLTVANFDKGKVLGKMKDFVCVATSDILSRVQQNQPEIVTMAIDQNLQVHMTSLYSSEQNEIMRFAPGIPQWTSRVRQLPENSNLANVVLNSDASLRAILIPSEGVFVMTCLFNQKPPSNATFSNILERLGFVNDNGDKIEAIVAVNIWTIANNVTLLACTIQTTKYLITTFFHKSRNEIVLQTVNQSKLLRNHLLTSNIFFAFQTIDRSKQTFVLCATGIDITSGNPVLASFSLPISAASTTNVSSVNFVERARVLLQNVTFTNKPFLKWDGWTRNDLANSPGVISCFCRSNQFVVEFAFETDANILRYPVSETFSPLISAIHTSPEFVQVSVEKDVIKFIILFPNSTLQSGSTIPPFAFDINKDVVALSPDGTKISVISHTNGHFYQFDLFARSWSDNVFGMFSSSTPAEIVETYPQVNNHIEWFLGHSFNPNAELPVYELIATSDMRTVAAFTSLHGIVRLAATDPVDFVVQQINLPTMILGSNTVFPRETRLYDTGEIVIYEVYTVKQKTEIWRSGTSDGQGSVDMFAFLEFPLREVTPGTLGSLASPNGRYLLLLYGDRVDLKINPFNVPRFTAYTVKNNLLTAAVSAQSAFCTSALSNTRSDDEREFVDNRCNCLPSARLAGRIYFAPTFANLALETQERLIAQVPCLLDDCTIEPSEYSNAAIALRNRCLAPTAVCASNVPSDINNMLVASNCAINVMPCQTNSNCPSNMRCSQGQCVAGCSDDATCIRANPNARCVNGNCSILDDTPTNNKQKIATTLFACIAMTLLILLVMFLALLCHFAVKHRIEQQQHEHYVSSAQPSSQMLPN